MKGHAWMLVAGFVSGVCFVCFVGADAPQVSDEMALRSPVISTASAVGEVAGAPGDLTVQSVIVNQDNKIGCVRLIMSLLRLQDDGAGNLDIITNPEALPIATSFFDQHASTVGVEPVDPENPTGQEMATCIFRKLRREFRSPHVTSAGKAPLTTYQSALEAANAAAEAEIEAALGSDQ